MTTSKKLTAPDAFATRNLTSACRNYLGNRWVLVVLATVAIVSGAMLNWSWLLAVGIAPILLTALPCLLMCGFGLCAHKLVGRAGATQPSQPAAGASSCCPPNANVATDRPPEKR